MFVYCTVVVVVTVLVVVASGAVVDVFIIVVFDISVAAAIFVAVDSNVTFVGYRRLLLPLLFLAQRW